MGELPSALGEKSHLPSIGIEITVTSPRRYARRHYAPRGHLEAGYERTERRPRSAGTIEIVKRQAPFERRLHLLRIWVCLSRCAVQAAPRSATAIAVTAAGFRLRTKPRVLIRNLPSSRSAPQVAFGSIVESDWPLKTEGFGSHLVEEA